MKKKTLLLLLASIFLASCLSIRPEPTEIPSQPDFVTATLAPAKTSLPSAISTVPAETIAPALTFPANCTNAAILLRDVTILDNTRVKAGEKFIKTWEFQNTGTCPWVGYTIRFSTGDSMNAPLSAPIADTPPNGNVQVSVELTAPSADGAYTATFTLNDTAGNAVPIGTEKSFWVKIYVGEYVPPSASSGIISTPSGNCVYGGNPNYVSEVVSLINSERANVGLPALTFNTQLAAFAQHHAEDMAYNNFLSHDGTDGTFTQRMRNSGVGVFSEILAIGAPQNAIDQWRMDEHWDFVLNPDATQIGVGYAYNSCSDYGGYFTADFQ